MSATARGLAGHERHREACDLHVGHLLFAAVAVYINKQKSKERTIVFVRCISPRTGVAARGRCGLCPSTWGGTPNDKQGPSRCSLGMDAKIRMIFASSSPSVAWRRDLSCLRETRGGAS